MWLVRVNLIYVQFSFVLKRLVCVFESKWQPNYAKMCFLESRSSSVQHPRLYIIVGALHRIYKSIWMKKLNAWRRSHLVGKMNAFEMPLLVRSLPGLGQRSNGSRLHHIHITSHTIYCISSHAIFRKIAWNGVNRLFVANCFFRIFFTDDRPSVDRQSLRSWWWCHLRRIQSRTNDLLHAGPIENAFIGRREPANGVQLIKIRKYK